ncbi:MAG TPA: hypothetical protein VGC76_20095 [Pyrinomonadaceae bacterium]|jgi:hypothetical protein
MKRTITEIFIEVEEMISVSLPELDSSIVESEESAVRTTEPVTVCPFCRQAIAEFDEKKIEKKTN